MSQTTGAAGGDVLLAIGTRKGMFTARSSDAGTTWTTRMVEPLLMREVAAVGVVPGPSGPRLLAGMRSEHWGPALMWSDDLAATWSEQEEGSVVFPADTGATLARVWQLQPDAARPDVVWAGCEPTSLWRSDDGGRTFALVRGLWDHPHRKDWGPGFGGAAVHTVLTRPPGASEPDRVLVAMSTGGVYVSADAGESFAPSNHGISAPFLPDPAPEYGQCVHKVAADAAPGVLYAQNHPGVYRSDDDGGSWTSIAAGLPSDFGFTVLAHPHRPGTIWTVPLEADTRRVPPGGRLRLHRSRDGGRSWTEVGAGLPDQAWTCSLRDASTVVDRGPDATPLVVLGTRDGCVYASTDEGDSVVPVAAHLPDVLSVRGVQLAS